ncbi:MAG: CoA transferase, partial [Alphaproteobacteria bacterium]|nr:CoA transferase [Alphaproteobacteria bacterium]
RDGGCSTAPAANEEREWRRFPAAVGHPEWDDVPRFASQQERQKNAPLLVATLDELFARHDMAHWRKAFGTHRITVGEVAKTEDIRDSDQVRAAGIVVPTVDLGLDAALTIDSPVWIEGAAKQAPRPAPEVGEHTLEILAEAGYDQAGIDDLRARGAMGPDS